MHRDPPPDSLPWSQEAESSVLGALMLNPDALDNVADLLQARHFFDQRHGRTFDAIVALVGAGKPADVVSVFGQLQTTGLGEGIDLPFLNDLNLMVHSARNIRHHADIVAERALMRGLMEAADDVKSLAITPGLPVAERIAQAQARLEALQVHKGRGAPEHAGAVGSRLLSRVQALADGRVLPGMSVGIPSMDHRLNGGLRGGKQYVLAARPSIGKSSLALQLEINLARDGVPCAFFSQEMPNDEQADRATANLGSILLDHLMSGQLRDDEWSRLAPTADELNSLPLFFDDQPALTLHDISAKARELKRKHGLKVLAIDYVQLCAGTKGQDIREVVMEVSRGTKVLAKQLDIAVILLSQLGRGVETRVSGRPQMNDLKESGAIEEDADVIMFLSENDAPPGKPKVMEVEFAKNRQGRKGSVPVAFDGGYQRWEQCHEKLQSKRAGKTFTEEV